MRWSGMLRGRCNAVSTKDIAYRLIGNNVAQISQCSDDAVITPAGVLFGQFDNQFGNLSADPRPTWIRSEFRSVELLRYELAIPREDGVRLCDAGSSFNNLRPS